MSRRRLDAIVSSGGWRLREALAEIHRAEPEVRGPFGRPCWRLEISLVAYRMARNGSQRNWYLAA